MGALIRVRVAVEEDLDRLLAIHTLAFPDPRNQEARLRNFTANPLGGLDRLRVAVDANDGTTIIGHAFLFDLEVFIAGKPLRTGAIATVGVLPAARGRGVAAELVSALLSEADRAGMAITMLYAFRHGFYTRLGFTQTSTYQVLAIVPASLPDHSALRHRVSHADGPDRAEIEAGYEIAATRSTGFLRRSSALWDSSFSDERVAYVVTRGPTGALSGACSYRLVQAEPHGKVILQVEDFFALESDATHALYMHLRRFKDQVAEIHVTLSREDPLVFALTDPDANRFGDAIVEHAIGRVCGGPLVKVASLSRVLAARGYLRDGEITIAAENTAFHVTVKNGVASVEAAGLDRADIVFDRGIASVLAGGLSVRDAVKLGWARATSTTQTANAAALLRADELLRTGPFFTLDSF